MKVTLNRTSEKLVLLRIIFFEILALCFSAAVARHRRHFLCSQRVKLRDFNYPSDESCKKDLNNDKRDSDDSMEFNARTLI
jgi:hypothetical protein